jgi:hypothetical protein
MNPINILTSTIDNLWMWTYGLVAGWGIAFSLLVAGFIFLLARHIRNLKKIERLEHRLIALERDFNIENNKWNKKQ